MIDVISKDFAVRNVIFQIAKLLAFVGMEDGWFTSCVSEIHFIYHCEPLMPIFFRCRLLVYQLHIGPETNPVLDTIETIRT